MSVRIILASTSEIRAALLRNAGVVFDSEAARIDEQSVKTALRAENATPRDIADTLAELKARKVSDRHPAALVIGCDQVLEFGGVLLSKPDTPAQAKAQLMQMRGQTHRLISAAVVYERGAPVWRHLGIVEMQMRHVSEAYLENYVARKWDSICHSVGAYKLEEEGVRLFGGIKGDYFHVLGLPLLELLGFLMTRGVLDT